MTIFLIFDAVRPIARRSRVRSGAYKLRAIQKAMATSKRKSMA